MQRTIRFQNFYLVYNLFHLPYLARDTMTQREDGTSKDIQIGYIFIISKLILTSRFQTFTLSFWSDYHNKRSIKCKCLYPQRSINTETYKWVPKLGNYKHITSQHKNFIFPWSHHCYNFFVFKTTYVYLDASFSLCSFVFVIPISCRETRSLNGSKQPNT